MGIRQETLAERGAMAGTFNEGKGSYLGDFANFITGGAAGFAPRTDTTYNSQELMPTPQPTANLNPSFDYSQFGSNITGGAKGSLAELMRTNPNEARNWYDTMASSDERADAQWLMDEAGMSGLSNQQMTQPSTTDMLNNKMINNSITESNRLGDEKAANMSGIGNTVSNINTVVQSASSLADMYVGFEQLDIARDTLSMAKEVHSEKMNEIKHIKGVRKRLTNDYKS